MPSAKSDKRNATEDAPNMPETAGWKRHLPKLVLVAILAVAVIILYPKLFGSSTTNSASDGGGTAQTSASSSSQKKLRAALAKKQVVLLLFHSTSCQPCLEMEAIVKDIEPQFKSKVTFVPVVVSDPRERPIVEEYGIQTIPTTFIFDKKGQSQVQVGVIPKEQLTATLEKLVNE